MNDVDFFGREHNRCPYGLYARLRTEAPVQRLVRPDGAVMWLVTRYTDVMAVLKDLRFKKDYRNALTPEQIERIPSLPEMQARLDQHMLSSDPPSHTRLRKLVSKAFTPRLVAQMRPRVQALADALIDAVLPRGELDLIDDYAFPLPITVIAELLGVPAADREQFRAWSHAAVADRSNPDTLVELAGALEACTAYLHALFAERRRQPRSDLVTALVTAEEAGGRLSDQELMSTVFLLLVAGHETTVNLIGNGVLALLTNPAELARLRADPALIESAVEECLRYDAPVATSTARFAAEDVEIAGVTIPRGAWVVLALGSANRDGTHFVDPDHFDINRSPDDHAAFGQGIHHCLGASLARLEGQIAIGTILGRLPDLRLAVPVAELAWRPSLLMRGMIHCPLRF